MLDIPDVPGWLRLVSGDEQMFVHLETKRQLGIKLQDLGAIQNIWVTFYNLLSMPEDEFRLSVIESGGDALESFFPGRKFAYAPKTLNHVSVFSRLERK